MADCFGELDLPTRPFDHLVGLEKLARTSANSDCSTGKGSLEPSIGSAQMSQLVSTLRTAYARMPPSMVQPPG